MKKAYYLSSCSTCKRILNELNLDGFDRQDIKEKAITHSQIEEMFELSMSYEALFSKRAQKYKSMGLKEKALTEDDYKNLILKEYTFLKRPVFITSRKIFIGNSKKTIEALKASLVDE
ncbi:arsenate reductase [Flavobacteriales bacterium]|jgi:arsenate reductase|nr:arsenate reductase [Flavobacteriales bacterium]